MKFDIFVSYSRKDLQIVQKIKEKIETTTSGRCWMDLNGIESGAIQFTSKIVEGIKSCRVFLFMLSAHSQQSEFALRELNFAYRKAKEDQIKVVIVNIDQCKMTDEFSFMYGQTDTIDWNDSSQCKKLIHDLCRWLSPYDVPQTLPFHNNEKKGVPRSEGLTKTVRLSLSNKSDVNTSEKTVLLERMREQRETILKDKLPSRNDPCPCGSGKKFKNCHGKGIVYRTYRRS